MKVAGKHCEHVQNYLETNLNDANDNNINKRGFTESISMEEDLP